MIEKTIKQFIENQNNLFYKMKVDKTKIDKKQKQVIVDMIIEVWNFYNEFEKRLNEKWLNNNNWQNDNLYSDFLDEFIDGYVDDFLYTNHNK